LLQHRNCAASKARQIRKKKAKPPATGSVRDLIDGYIASDPLFREALIREAVEAMLGGDVETGKTILRDYIESAWQVRRSTTAPIA